ncbi:HdeD family acid-resistance protein [Micropruina sp.]|uniref:HdeD family acid-resistance protein n=1 Tax=Micropruina sp. TaxID=2737536 RepID=UPI0039E53154
MADSAFDNNINNPDRTATNGIRSALGIAGTISLIVGIVILVWPGKSAMVVAGIIAVWLLLAGIVNLAIGVFSRQVGTRPRIGYLVLGALLLIAAVFTFGNLGTAAASLGVLLGIIVGISWVIEGLVGLTMLGDTASKVWTLLFSLLSIVAGIVVLFSPLWGATVLWLLLGFSLVILGIAQIVRGLRFGTR